MPDGADEYAGLSSVEELDRGPEPKSGLTYAREFAVGGLLLLAVLGWAGWETWRQQAIEANYRAAQAASERRDWDQAHESFLAAGEYRDARARATETAELIEQRDKYYEEALWWNEKKKWAAALKAVQALRGIQPDYRDVSVIGAQAEAEVYRGAVKGVVALRNMGNPPGLYYHTGEHWVWLEGSDRYSRVRGYGRGNRVIYDVPGEGWKPPANPTPTPRTYSYYPRGSPELAKRKVVVANVGEAPFKYVTMAFDPARYNYYVLTEWGAWAVVQSAPRSGDMQISVRANVAFAGSALTYQDYSNPTLFKLDPSGENWFVMDLSPVSDEVLQVEVLNWRRADQIVNLYLTNASGSYKRLVLSQPGGMLGRCQFGPDGRSVLVSRYSDTDNPRLMKQEIVLLDLRWEAARGRVSIIQQVEPENILNRVPPMGATFLGDAYPAGSFLLVQQTGGRATFSIREMDGTVESAASLTVTAASTGALNSPYIISQMKGDRRVLITRPVRGGRDVIAGAGTILLDPGKPPITATLQHEDGGWISGAVIRGDALVYSVNRLDNAGGAPFGTETYKSSVYSAPLSGLGNPDIKPTMVYSTTIGDFEPFASEMIMGENLLSYTENGQLHARTYDGATDVTLEGGISFLLRPSALLGESAWIYESLEFLR